MYCSFRKPLQEISNLHLFLQIQMSQMSFKNIHHLPSVIKRLNVLQCDSFVCIYERYMNVQ